MMYNFGLNDCEIHRIVIVVFESVYSYLVTCNASKISDL